MRLVLMLLTAINASAPSVLVKDGTGGVKMGLNGAPEYSPATGLKNKFYNWKGEKIRYQVTGPEDAEQSLLLGENKHSTNSLILCRFLFILVFLVTDAWFQCTVCL